MNDLFIIIAMLALSAFFSGMEIAFVAANKLRMELDKNKNTMTSRIINIFTNHPGHYISTMLVGNNIALVVYGIMMAKILEPTIALWIDSELLIMTIQTLFSTLLILFTAEFLPKTLFRLNPNFSLNLFAVPVMFFYVIFYPITVITMMFSKNIISRVLNTDITEEEESRAFGKIDLDHLVQEGQEGQAVFDEDEHNMKLFRNALDFSNVKLRECFVPRTEIEAIEIGGEISVNSTFH